MPGCSAQAQPRANGGQQVREVGVKVQVHVYFGLSRSSTENWTEFLEHRGQDPHTMLRPDEGGSSAVQVRGCLVAGGSMSRAHVGEVVGAVVLVCGCIVCSDEGVGVQEHAADGDLCNT